MGISFDLTFYSAQGTKREKSDDIYDSTQIYCRLSDVNVLPAGWLSTKRKMNGYQITYKFKRWKDLVPNMC